MSPLSLAERGQPCNPFPVESAGNSDRPPVEWLPWRRPGELAAEVRSVRLPLDPRSSDALPILIDPAWILPGDRISSWLIEHVSTHEHRVHGWACHCVWQVHVRVGCSYDNPDCPCWSTVTEYMFTCRCDCGLVKPVCTDCLIRGTSLSCGHCHHRDMFSHSLSPGCGHPVPDCGEAA
jgi:hypothetical protein